MELRLTVFSRRMGRRTFWWTLGLGSDNVAVSGADDGAARQRLIDRLRKTFARRWPVDLQRSEFIRGRRLEVVRLDLQFPREQGRTRLRGRVPLVLEPRPRGPGLVGALVLAYHPMRPHETFVHEEGRALTDEAERFFRERWTDLGEDERESLLQPEEGKPRDQLQVLAFRVEPKRLLQALDDAPESPRAFLGGGPRETGEVLLRRLGSNVTTLAIDRRLATGMPRIPYRGQLQQLLCGHHKKPVLLVGESGVGKSVLLRQWVADLLDAEDFPSHRSLERIHSVWEISGRRIIAGMSYLGQWEQRCVDLIAATRKHRALLWISDIASWGRIGESRESERSLATMFRGPLGRGEVLLVGECTAQGYQQLKDDAPAFAAAFTPLFIEPTDPELTLRLLVHEARRLELEHRVAFDPRAFRTLLELGGTLGAGTAMPGHVLDLLRSLATDDPAQGTDLSEVERSAQRGHKLVAIRQFREKTSAGLKEAKQAVERFLERGTWPAARAREDVPVAPRSLLDRQFSSARLGASLGSEHVIRLLVRRTGMPEMLLSPTKALEAADVRAAFEGQIMGQPTAVAAMTDLVLRIKSGLSDAGRPYGVFLFTGPTGTGKTEMAKCLAEYLYGDGTQRLVRLDMSEFNGYDAPARLIGDRFAPEGVLTSKVRAQPFCVVLLDEIEKATPAVLNLLLQLFDDGRLTDATGTLVDFRHTVLIMTSNLGARTTASVGFGEDVEAGDHSVGAAVRDFFPPELFNRIDRVVPFAPLSHAAARRIAARELSALLDRRGLTERNIFVRSTPAVLELAVREGFRARDGARSLKRYLEDHVGAYLADEIAARPAAAVRMFWLYPREGRLHLAGKHLEEARIGDRTSGFEALVRGTLSELRTHVPVALARARALLESATWVGLDVAVKGSLAQYEAGGDASVGDHVFRLESLRGELLAVTDRLQTQLDYDPLLRGALTSDERSVQDAEIVEAEDFGHIPRTYASGVSGIDGVERQLKIADRRSLAPHLPLQNRRDFLAGFEALAFVERALEHVGDPAEHALLIELTRISRSAGTSRFEITRPGLLEWLAEAYANARGELEEAVFVAAVPDGKIQDLRRSVRIDHAVGQMVLRLVGPGVRTQFQAEEGCHVRESLTGGTEVVRVRLYPAPEVTAHDHVAGVQARKDAYVAALESGATGGPPPDDPEAILPIVRRYHYDPQPGSLQTWLDVEDYPLGYAERRQVKRLAEILPDLWLLHLGHHWDGVAP